MLKVTLYSKYNCQWCEMLKVRLINMKIDYTELRVDDNVDNLDKLRNLIPGVKTVPQMFVDEVGLIGTYEQSTAWLNGYSFGKACWCATHDTVTGRFIGTKQPCPTCTEPHYDYEPCPACGSCENCCEGHILAGDEGKS